MATGGFARWVLKDIGLPFIVNPTLTLQSLVESGTEVVLFDLACDLAADELKLVGERVESVVGGEVKFQVAVIGIGSDGVGRKAHSEIEV